MKIESQASKLLVIPQGFRETALSFPSKVDQAIATISNAREANGILAQADTLAHFAKRVKADTEIVNAIQYGKLKIVAKIGELAPARSREETGRGKTITPNVIDIHPNSLTKYRKVSANVEKLDAYRDKCSDGEELTIGGFVRFATGTEKAGTAAHVSSNTGIPEWYTPPEYIAAAREVLGKIDLDPASSVIAQRTVKAKRYFTIDDDGLSQDWAGNVWMNPPYTSDLIAKFMDKLCHHVADGEIKHAIALINNATETRWFQTAAVMAAAVCFPVGRIKFLDESGKPGAPLQGQSVLYFGDGAGRFIESFKVFGVCFGSVQRF